MKTRLFALVLLGWCSTANAQALTSETLVGWCNDAYGVFTGMSGTPLLHQDKARSNATACAAYLRGWLEREANARAEIPNAQCRTIGDNAEMISGFLKLVHQPGYQPRELNAMMTDFGGLYCPPLPAKTQIAGVMPEISNIPAPPPTTPIMVMPPAMDAPPVQTQVAELPPAPAEVAELPPVAELPVAPPAAQIVAEAPPPVLSPAPPEVKLTQAPQPMPVPLALMPVKPPEPVIDPTQTRIISARETRMLEADEQSVIAVIR